MWEMITGGTGLADAALGLRERWLNSRSEAERRVAKRALGEGIMFYAATPISNAMETWRTYFNRSSELARQFDQAATFEEYLLVFQKMGFIDGQPTEEQHVILSELVHLNVESAPPHTRILIGEVVKLASQVGETRDRSDLAAETEGQALVQAVEMANARYLRASLPRHSFWREREDIESVLTVLRRQNTPAAQLITGMAGLGKSGMSALIVEQAQALGWPVLAFRLDLVSPTDTTTQLGANLGLPASPVGVLAGVAAGRDCLLVIDQLDAVSQASGRQPQFFEVVRDLLDEARRHANMRVLLACRDFDLQNDDRFQQLLRGESPQAEVVTLSHLPTEQVDAALREAGFQRDRLTAQQIELLRLPLHLTLLLESWNGSTDTQAWAFQTVNDLYRLYTQRKETVLRQRDPNFRLVSALTPLVAHMHRALALSVPESVTDLLPLKNRPPAKVTPCQQWCGYTRPR